MKTAFALMAASLVLAAHGPVGAESLQQARLKVFQGTTPGISLFGSAASASPEAAASGASASAPAPAGDTRSVMERLSAALRTSPPSGDPMNAGKRLDSPSVGIPLSTAASASASAGAEPVAKGR